MNTMKHFGALAIDKPQDLVFGKSVHPVTTRRGLVIGGGRVHPEINFTVPPMEINDSTFPDIVRMYSDTVREICERAVALDCEGFVVEFETLVEMTRNPAYAENLVRAMNDVLEESHAKHGIKTAIRMTPNDLREFNRPPVLRSGEMLDRMMETFERTAAAGGELLSIESTGGKEIHDPALLSCDLSQVIFALGVLGPRDMDFLWPRIVSIAKANGTVAGGDTACGFGNTAMILAGKRNIPKVFAAVVRAVSTVRSLPAYEHGAEGPGKDCGYENVYLKAITGLPMSMEGKTAACAHLSPVGNVASAACDLWSNESVQAFKLLGGMAPLVSFEQLVYDCRLMNRALETGVEEVLKNLFVISDAGIDPQALVLSPESAIRIARSVVESSGRYEAAVNAARTGIEIIEEAYREKKLKLDARELPYLALMTETLNGLPGDESAFIEKVLPGIEKNVFIPSEYGL